MTRADAELIGAQRLLQDAIAGAAMPTDTAERITAQLREVAAKVARFAVPESARRDGRQPALPGRGMPFMPPYLIDEEGPDFTKGRVRFTRFYLGGHGAAHGGAHAVLFDDIMGRLATRVGGEGRTRTARLTINYRRIIPTDTDIAFEAWVDRTEGRKRFVSARLYDDTGAVGADCEGLFVVLRPGRT
ncbi:MAG TPA: hotdog fold domain-containing protein [Pseudonocardiaceae bacterium]|jgi:acyl-coenzyme A thioesterase PaaI-like protein|nr:hotdog fold domain-containing protein [Pseudonocardiaceae bacterium]